MSGVSSLLMPRRALALLLLSLVAMPVVAQPLDEKALDREIVPDLIKQLDGPESRKVLHQLQKLGPYARPALLEAADHVLVPRLLKKFDESHDKGAIYELQDLGPDARSAVPELLRRLPAVNEDDRGLFLWTLGHIHADSTHTLPVLLEALKDTDVVDIAFWALAQFGETAAPAFPEMTRVLREGRISAWGEKRVMEERGPFAAVAAEYYRSLIFADNEESPPYGLSMALLISSGDAVAIQSAVAELQHGSVRRRCRLARLLVSRPEVVAKILPTVTELADRDDYACRGVLGRELARLDLGAVGERHEAETSALPHLRVRLKFSKPQYYAGEEILVTPVLESEKDRDLVGRSDSVVNVFETKWAGFQFLQLRTATGAPVQQCSAIPSGDVWNVMHNGRSYYPPSGPYALNQAGRFFVRTPGHYKLTIPETEVHLEVSTGPIVVISGEPADLVILPATEQFITRSLREISAALADPDGGHFMERERAAERLNNLTDTRAVPLLVRELEAPSKPGMIGPLTFPNPKAVAQEIRRAIGEGRPKDPWGMRLYGDVLARTERGWPASGVWCSDVLKVEHSWPAPPSASFSQMQQPDVAASAERWRLLLEHRQRIALAKKKLTPEETIRALKDEFISPATPGACEAAWREVLIRPEGPARDYFRTSDIVWKCSDRRFVAQLWKVARDKKYHADSRVGAYLKLRDLGEKDWLTDVLADMASSAPSLGYKSNSAYEAALKERPAEVGGILQRKLESGEREQAIFAVELLAFLGWARDERIDVPLDIPAASKALLASPAYDGTVCGAFAHYLRHRDPRAALALIREVLARRKQRDQSRRDAIPYYWADPINALADLPEEIGGPLIRELLRSDDLALAAAMMSRLGGQARDSLEHNRASLEHYFPDLLAYFQRTVDREKRSYAAEVMQKISNIPEDGVIDGDPAMEHLLVKAWGDWIRHPKPAGKARP